MKNLLMLFGLIVCMNYAGAQIERIQVSVETQTIESNEENGFFTIWYYLPLRQQYMAELRRLPDSVLLSRTIHADLMAFNRVGEHLKFFENEKLYLKGQYKENKRDGEWLIFNEEGEVVLKEYYQKGQFLNGHRVSASNEISDFRELITANNGDFIKLVSTLLTYPASCRRNGIEGKVWIDLQYHAIEQRWESKVLWGSHPDLNKAAKEAVDLAIASADIFIRGKVPGSEYFQLDFPIIFKLGW